MIRALPPPSGAKQFARAFEAVDRAVRPGDEDAARERALRQAERRERARQRALNRHAGYPGARQQAVENPVDSLARELATRVERVLDFDVGQREAKVARVEETRAVSSAASRSTIPFDVIAARKRTYETRNSESHTSSYE